MYSYNSQRGSVPVILLVVLVFSVIGFWAYTQNNKSAQSSESSQSVKLMDPRLVGEFPAEIKDVKSQDLVEFKCSTYGDNLYHEVPDDLIYIKISDDEKSVVDKKTRDAFIHKIDKTKYYPERIQFCKSEDGQTIQMSQLYNKQSTGLRTVTYEMVSPNGEVILIGSIENVISKDANNNFIHNTSLSCMPIILTKSGAFYYECSSTLTFNEGKEANPEIAKSESKSVLVKVDLKNRQVTSFNECTNDGKVTLCK